MPEYRDWEWPYPPTKPLTKRSRPDSFDPVTSLGQRMDELDATPHTGRPQSRPNQGMNYGTQEDLPHRGGAAGGEPVLSEEVAGSSTAVGQTRQEGGEGQQS